MALTQDIYKINAKIMLLCYKKFVNLCQTSKKCEYVMLDTLSGKFNAISGGNVRNMMLNANAATLRGLTYFILWLI